MNGRLIRFPPDGPIDAAEIDWSNVKTDQEIRDENRWEILTTSGVIEARQSFVDAFWYGWHVGLKRSGEICYEIIIEQWKRETDLLRSKDT